MSYEKPDVVVVGPIGSVVLGAKDLGEGDNGSDDTRPDGGLLLGLDE